MKQKRTSLFLHFTSRQRIFNARYTNHIRMKIYQYPWSLKNTSYIITYELRNINNNNSAVFIILKRGIWNALNIYEKIRRFSPIKSTYRPNDDITKGDRAMFRVGQIRVTNGSQARGYWPFGPTPTPHSVCYIIRAGRKRTYRHCDIFGAFFIRYIHGTDRWNRTCGAMISYLYLYGKKMRMFAMC